VQTCALPISAIGYGDKAGAREGEGAAAVGAGAGRNVIGSFLAIPVGGAEANLRVALIGILEIHPAIVGRPLRPLNVAVEFLGNGVGPRAIAVHQVKLGGLVALQAVVEARVGDPFSI